MTLKLPPATHERKNGALSLAHSRIDIGDEIVERRL